MDCLREIIGEKLANKLVFAFLNNKIIARIPVTDSANTNMYNDNSDFITKQRTYATPVTINKLYIRLLDKYGDIIDNNNNDMSFLLEFTRIIK